MVMENGKNISNNSNIRSDIIKCQEKYIKLYEVVRKIKHPVEGANLRLLHRMGRSLKTHLELIEGKPFAAQGDQV